MTAAIMRLDRLLHQLRFAKSRSLAQRWIGEGHIRRNGVRVTRQDQPMAPGDVLTLPLARSVLVIELLSLPPRRGSPAEARLHYRPLDASRTNALAGDQPGGPPRSQGRRVPEDGPMKGEAHQ